MPIRTIAKVFSDRDWRDDLDPDLVNKLEKLVSRTKTYEEAYQNAESPAQAQLWVATAEVFAQLERLSARVRRLEETQRQLIEAAEEAGIEDEELRKSLEQY